MRRNLVLLALCQGLGTSAVAMVVSVTSVIGAHLAPDPALATLPFALQWLSVALFAAPLSHFMARYGRRAGFVLGALSGMTGGLCAAYAVVNVQYPLFCLASVLIGLAAISVQSYRFAAADMVEPQRRGRAISLVIAGGVIAGFLGPQLAAWSRTLIAGAHFAGAFLVIAGLMALICTLLAFVAIPRSPAVTFAANGRPLAEIARQPAFLLALAAALVGYGAMNLIMASTPLAIVHRHGDFDTAAFVIQWHILAMYGPSFFTGRIIARIGIVWTLALGAALALACVAVNLSGQGVAETWVALVLLGLGWNFLFVGGTTLLTSVYRPEERAKVQGLNDSLVFGAVAFTSLSSGAVYAGFGWAWLNLVTSPFILAVALLAFRYGRLTHARAGAE